MMKAHVLQVKVRSYNSSTTTLVPIAVLARDGTEALTTIKKQLAFEGDVAVTGDILSDDHVRTLSLSPNQPRIIEREVTPLNDKERHPDCSPLVQNSVKADGSITEVGTGRADL